MQAHTALKLQTRFIMCVRERLREFAIKNGATIYLSGVVLVGVGALWKLGHGNDSTYVV